MGCQFVLYVVFFVHVLFASFLRAGRSRKLIVCPYKNSEAVFLRRSRSVQTVFSVPQTLATKPVQKCGQASRRKSDQNSGHADHVSKTQLHVYGPVAPSLSPTWSVQGWATVLLVAAQSHSVTECRHSRKGWIEVFGGFLLGFVPGN